MVYIWKAEKLYILINFFFFFLQSMFPTPQNFSHNILAAAASVIWGQGAEPPLDAALWLQGCSLGCLLHRHMSPCTGSAWQVCLHESDTLIWKSRFLGHIASLVFPPLSVFPSLSPCTLSRSSIEFCLSPFNPTLTPNSHAPAPPKKCKAVIHTALFLTCLSREV